jgi:hypothetical protein
MVEKILLGLFLEKHFVLLTVNNTIQFEVY